MWTAVADTHEFLQAMLAWPTHGCVSFPDTRRFSGAKNSWRKLFNYLNHPRPAGLRCLPMNGNSLISSVLCKSLLMNQLHNPNRICASLGSPDGCASGQSSPRSPLRVLILTRADLLTATQIRRVNEGTQITVVNS